MIFPLLTLKFSKEPRGGSCRLHSGREFTVQANQPQTQFVQICPSHAAAPPVPPKKKNGNGVVH